MRLFISILIFITYSQGSFCQIKIDTELGLKLEGKTKFQDIKSTVWSHLTEKLAALDNKDSMGTKAILRQMKKWNREFWINEYYTNEKGEVEPKSKVIMNALAKRNREKPKESNRGQAEGWVSTGPDYSDHGIGRIDRIAFHPTDPNILYAASPNGGLFKSINAGVSWYPISEFVAPLGISGIAIHPTNPNIIYVLSGDGDSNGGCFAGQYCLNIGELISASDGIYKSSNGGDTWIKLNSFPGLAPIPSFRGRQIIIHPTNPQILFAATSIGLFRTQNDGIKWDRVSDVVNIWDVKLKPNDPQTVYITGNNAFGKSTDGGINFTMINVPSISAATRISMAVTPANPNKVMLFAGQSMSAPAADIFTGIFTSTDSGSSFTTTFTATNIFNNFIGQNVLSGQVEYNNNIEISRTDENVVFTGGLVIWKSTDGGSTWNQSTAYWPVGPNYVHPDHHCLKINPLNNKLYNGNDGGVYVSSTESNSWEYISVGLSTSQFYHFEEENDVDNTWGGCQDNGIQERVDGYQFHEFDGGDGYDVMTDHPSRSSDGNSENIFYTVNRSVYTDCGISGDPCNITVPQNVCNGCPNEFFGNLAMHPEDNETIYAGYQTNVYKSINSGDTWISLSGGRPGNWSICAGKNHTERLYVSGTNTSMGTGIWRLDDATWTPIPLPSPYLISQKISDIEIDKLNDDHVYVSCAGTIGNSKVYESTDAGVTWTNISFNIPQNEPVFCLLRDPSGGLYAGTTIGVYYKRADQNHWEPFYNDLPPVPVTQIVFEEEESIFVHCSTFGRGLWRTLKYNTDCVENRNMTGLVSGRNYWEASNIITSTQIIDDSPGTHITYNAGNKVILSPGLRAKLGTTLKVFATGCGGQVDLSKPANPKKKNKKQRALKVSEDLKK